MKKIIRKTVGATDRIGPILGAIVALVGLIMVSNAITPRGSSTQSAASQDRKGGAVVATKIAGERSTQIFNLATARAASGAENPSDATLSTDQTDYPPFSYVHISGTGFQGGETVNLIVVELSPTPAAYEPWDAVADADGNFETTWYIFSDDFIGATMQVTGTGQSSGSTASAIFTDAPNPPSSPTPTPCALGFFGNAAGFQIDANFFSNSDPCMTGGTADWAGPNGVLLKDGSGNVIIPPSPPATCSPSPFPSPGANVIYNPATNSAFVRDGVYCQGSNDLSIFAGGQKNDDPIDPTSTHWKTDCGGGQQKNDLTNVYVHTRVDSSTMHRWLVLASETRATNGDSYVDFEYNQAGLTWDTANQIIHGCTNGGNCVGGRTVGDLLVVVNFSNGGTLPTAEIRTWLDTGAWSDATPPPAGAVFIVNNPLDIPAVSPGAGYLANNSCDASNTTVTLQFVETAIDLTAFNFPALNACNPLATINVKSRASASFTSALSDFVLFNFQISPAAPCDITGPDSVCPGTQNLQYCAPAGAASYAWSISGNGTIVGSTTGPCVTVNAGSTCNTDFILSVTTTNNDNCPNICGKTVHVEDTTPPTIGGQGANSTIECPATPSFTAPTASDNCSGTTVQPLGDTTSGNSCALVTTRSWRAIDACGNTSGTVSQSITRADTTAPTIGNAGANSTIECPATPSSFTAPTASDTCGAASVILDSDTTAAGTCANNFSRTRTWHAVDACGNTSATRAQTITVRDTTPPAIGGQGANQTVECPATATFTAPTASDACGGASVQNLGDTTSGNCAAFVTVRSWRAVDACGNTSGTVTQSITTGDTTPPVIGNAGANATIECTASPSFTAPTASDACGGASVILDSETTAAGTCANNFSRTRTWHAVDSCGNTSAIRRQTITVVDTTPPVIGNAGANATIECTATPSFTAPTASDACGGYTVNFLGETTTAGTCAANYTAARSWNAVDDCGNTSATRTQTITVVDSTAPTIGSPGADTTIDCTATPVFSPPTASDTCSAVSVVQVSDSTIVNCHGNPTLTCYTRCWRAVDDCGNTSGTVCQTITVFCPPTMFCTRTQGFYGNSGGMFTNPDSCYNGLRVPELLRALLGDPAFCAPNPNPQTLVVGKPGRSLTIPLSASACITMRLPAGGSAAALPTTLGDATLDASSCQTSPTALPLKNGKFNNVFLGQVITLSLNTRLDPNLGGLILHSQFCTIGSGGGISTVNIPQVVLTALDTVYGVHPHTVNELLDLANRALAGQSTGAAKVSDINNAVDAINGAFDECRGLLPACPPPTPTPTPTPRPTPTPTPTPSPIVPGTLS